MMVTHLSFIPKFPNSHPQLTSTRVRLGMRTVNLTAQLIFGAPGNPLQGVMITHEAKADKNNVTLFLIPDGFIFIPRCAHDS